MLFLFIGVGDVFSVVLCVFQFVLCVVGVGDVFSLVLFCFQRVLPKP